MSRVKVSKLNSNHGSLRMNVWYWLEALLAEMREIEALFFL